MTPEKTAAKARFERRDQKKRKRMKVSGRRVLELKKIIASGSGKKKRG